MTVTNVRLTPNKEPSMNAAKLASRPIVELADRICG
jgi:hypothetical protein